MDRLLEFTQKVKPGDMALVFYAGHGVAIGGGNYLLLCDIAFAGPQHQARIGKDLLSEADDLIYEI